MSSKSIYLPRDMKAYASAGSSNAGSPPMNGLTDSLIKEIKFIHDWIRTVRLENPSMRINTAALSEVEGFQPDPNKWISPGSYVKAPPTMPLLVALRQVNLVSRYYDHNKSLVLTPKLS